MKSLDTSQIGTMAELLKNVYIDISGKSAFSRFQRMYRNDRIAFVYDCLPDLGNTLADYQEEILGYFDDGYSKVAVRGSHGLGKTTIAAVLTHHTVLTADTEAKVPTTASAWRQLERYLWPEIRKVSKLINWSNIGRPAYDLRTELLSLQIKLKEGLVQSFAVASDDHTTMEGAHAISLFYILDEAKSIPRPTWDAIEGAFSNAGAKVLGETTLGEYGVGEYGVFPRDRDSSHQSSLKNTQDNSPQNYVPAKNSTMKDVYKALAKNVDDDIPEIFRSEKAYIGSNGVITSDDTGLLASEENIKKLTDAGVYRDMIEDDDSDGVVEERVTSTSLGNSNIASSKDSSDVIKEHPMSPRLPHSALKDPLSHSNALQSSHNTSSHGNTSKSSHITVIDDHTQVRSAGIVSTVYEARAFAISTPGAPSGQFYDIHMRKPGFEDWIARHVTIDEAVRAGRVSSLWVAQREKQWGRDSAMFQNRVLGEFADTSEEGVIPLSWVLSAQSRWKEWRESGSPDQHGKRTLGVDVARAGDDKTVIAVRDAFLVPNLYVFSKLPTTATTGHVKVRAENRYIHIETDGGLGAAVYDNLREQGVPLLRPITVGGSTKFRDKSKQLSFDDVRSAMWWNMRELLDPDNGEEVALPPVEELKIDLTAPKWDMISDGVVKVESKKLIRERIGRSTDYGDAVCLAFWSAGSGGGVVI